MKFPALLMLATGCVSEVPDVETGTLTQHAESENGISMNGISMNGISMNGISMNGISMNGISMNGISMNGPTLDAAAFDGSTWTARLSNGTTVPIRIDDTFQIDDLGFYAASFEVEGAWYPLCGTADAYALAVPGVWNMQLGTIGGGGYSASDTEFTFACRGTSIAKCVELGYKPWHGYADQLAACVRMLRADYCGDGIAYTTEGNRINVYDDVGVQHDTASWPVEAEWSPFGARCVTNRLHETRFLANLSQGMPVPSCIKTIDVSSSCGTFRAGTVLVNEFDAPTAGSTLIVPPRR